MAVRPPTAAALREVLNNRYALGDLIAEGGMAQVYRGRDRVLDRDVAVKILRPQYAASPEFLDRFRREARIAASLTHANLVNVFDVGDEGSRHYIVMELLPGKTLKDLVTPSRGRPHPLALDQAVDLVRQIAAGMGFAHRRGLVHRDLKPQNVLITEDGHAKVGDFGLAQAAETAHLTVPGTVWGTVQYISPEQAQGLAADSRSDIYSLGAIFYELLTGRLPYEAATPPAIMVKHVYDPPPVLREANPALPAAAERVVTRAMAKNPAERYQTMDELAQALAELRDAAAAETMVWKAPAAFVAPANGHGRRRGAAGASFPPAAPDRTLALRAPATPRPVPDRPPPPRRPAPNAARAAPGPPQRRRSPAWLPVALAGAVLAFFALMAVGAVVARAMLPRQNLARQTATAAAAAQLTPTTAPETPTPAPTPIPQVPVPNVAGNPLPTAQAKLNAAGLAWDTAETFSKDVPSGAVVDQDPPANARLEQGKPVKLTVSKGPQTASVPGVVGDPFATANEKLAKAGFAVDRQDVFNTQADRGIVFAQDPGRGVDAPLGSKVTVRVSLGREQAVVPRVIGQPETAARDRLTKEGFAVEVSYEAVTNVEPGQVFAQSPQGDAQVDKGSPITIRVRRDPTPVPPTATHVPPTASAVPPTASAGAAQPPTRPAASPTAGAAGGGGAAATPPQPAATPR